MALVSLNLRSACVAVGQVDFRLTIRADNALRNALIDSFSMRNFVPGKQSGA